MKSDQMIKKAQAKNKIAIKLKNEWRDTRKLIKNAKKLMLIKIMLKH